MIEAYIIGTGMVRFGSYPARTVNDMAWEATNIALKNAGVNAKALESIFFSNTFWGLDGNQHAIRGQVALRGMGIDTIPIVNVENACAGGATALHLAVMAIASGMHDLTLVLGAEKTTRSDPLLSSGAAAIALMDVSDIDNALKRMDAFTTTFLPEISNKERPCQKKRAHLWMNSLALGARWHMSRFGSTRKQLAVICSKNYYHGSLNPLARFRTRLSPEEIMAEPPVFFPLSPSMCALEGDGAAALLVCSRSYLKKTGLSARIRIIASVLGSGRERDIDAESMGERLSKKAYHMAGVGPSDIDLAEIHDITAYGELHQTEAMGFCPIGEGGLYAESGATRLGGEKPINTGGGIECRSHATGATGLAQIIELCAQLNGEAGSRQVENARIGLAENDGGMIGIEAAAMAIHILEKTD
jgi:acetyl-CoA acetyltransferase